MTGYTVHTGSTEKFASGWDAIFRRGAAKKSPPKKQAVARKPATKKAAKKAIRSKTVRRGRKTKR